MQKIWEDIVSKGSYKTLKNKKISEEFNHLMNESIYAALEKYTDESTVDKLKKDEKGLKNIHLYIDPSLRTRIQDYVSSLVKVKMLKLTVDLGHESLNFSKDHNFLLDLMVITRIHFPIEYAIKSTQSYQDYCAERGRTKFSIDPSVTSSYHNDLPYAAWSHGPHCDSWVGHSFDGINLWWAYEGVNEQNGVTIYPNFVGLDTSEIKVILEPPYVDRDVQLEAPLVPKLLPGEVFAFNSDILHGTRVNTSNETRISASTRINPSIPTFNKDVFRFVKLWAFSSNIKSLSENEELPNIEESHGSTEVRKTSEFYFVADKNIEGQFSNTCKKKLESRNIIFNVSVTKFKDQIDLILKDDETKYPFELIKICSKDIFNKKGAIVCIKFINKEKVFKTVVLRKYPEKEVFIAHDNFCSHLGYELLYSEIKNGYVVSQGHGLQYSINKKESKNLAGNFKLNFYKIHEDSQNIYLLKSQK